MENSPEASSSEQVVSSLSSLESVPDGSILNSAKTPEDKVKACLSIMTNSLAIPGVPKFKEFWDAKRKCLEFFKELTSSRIRAQLWGQYIELSTEAKRLKEIIDEQSAFAAEQIDLAIQLLEKDLLQYHTLLDPLPEVALLCESKTLKGKKEIYNQWQKELHFLATLASRINALRKELMKTEIRLGVKSKLFDKLSACGDIVFPKRKELIKKVSDAFVSDVEHFIAHSFRHDNKAIVNLYEIREEVKVLQSLAKELSLNTQAFSSTRLQLSQCWDRMKEEEKQKKKVWEEKKLQSKELIDQLLKKIEEFAAKVKEGMEHNEVIAQEKAILDEMDAAELLREDQKKIRFELAAAKEPMLKKIEEEKQLQKAKKEEQESLKKKAKQDVENQLSSLLTEAKSGTDIQDKLKDLHAKINAIQWDEQQKVALENGLFHAEDIAAEKKVESLLGNPQASLDDLYNLLDNRYDRRQMIRDDIEKYRQALGGSSFDFERGMFYRDIMESQKEELSSVQVIIGKLEAKIAKLEE